MCAVIERTIIYIENCMHQTDKLFECPVCSVQWLKWFCEAGGRVVFVVGKPGNFPLTGSDLPSHWFV